MNREEILEQKRKEYIEIYRKELRKMKIKNFFGRDIIEDDKNLQTRVNDFEINAEGSYGIHFYELQSDEILNIKLAIMKLTSKQNLKNWDKCYGGRN